MHDQITFKSYGLNEKYLNSIETFSQPLTVISPTMTAVAIIPGVFALTGDGTCLCYLFTTFALILVALNINIFAKRSASPGSLYTYTARGMGASVGFVCGWSLIFAYLISAMGVFAGSIYYLVVLLNMLQISVSPVILFGIGTLIAWFIAYDDIKFATRFVLVLEGLSMVIILILGAIIMKEKGVVIDYPQFKLSGLNANSFEGGMILAIFSYIGFESAPTLGVESKKQLIAIPRAVLWSTIVAGLFFILCSYIAILGFRGLPVNLAASTTPYNDLAKFAGVEYFGVFISCGAVISLFCAMLATINGGARMLFAMGRHEIFPRVLGNAHPTNHTPYVSVTFFAIFVFMVPSAMFAGGMQLLDIFNDLTTISTYGFLAAYILISIAAPLYLKGIGQLTVSSIVLSIITVLLMTPAVISSFTSAPSGILFYAPYIFLAYVFVGLSWFTYKKTKSPQVLNAIQAEIEMIDRNFKLASS